MLANGATSWQLRESILNSITGIMRFVVKSGLSICIFLLIFKTVDTDSNECAVVVDTVKSDEVVVVNKTDVLGETIDANDTSLEQHGAAIVGNVSEEKKRSLAIFFILFVIMLATLVVHMLIVSKLHWMPEACLLTRHTNEIHGAFTHVDGSANYQMPGRVKVYKLNSKSNKASECPIAEGLDKKIASEEKDRLVVNYTLFTAVTRYGRLEYVTSSNKKTVWLQLLKCNMSRGFFEAFEGKMIGVEHLALVPATLAFGHHWISAGFKQIKQDSTICLLFSIVSIDGKTNDTSKMETKDRTYYITFAEMFFFSVRLRDGIGLLSAMLFKHVDLRKTPSLEFALLLIFSYIPYGFAEALDLSGIMAILFCGISMSQYTRHNVSPIAQITFRHTFRTISFVAETSTFAYIGMAFFTIKLNFAPWLIFWSVTLCLLGRACNVFPLAYLVNQCRKDVQISMKNQIIMWFSGMRGAVCFALVLYMDLDKEKKSILLTTVLFLILFTTIFLGGSALPFISFINRCYPNERQRKRRRTPRNQEQGKNSSALMMSKTQEMSFFGSDDWGPKKSALDATSSAGRLMRSLFVRKFTASERLENRDKLAALTKRALASDQMTDSDDVEFGTNPRKEDTTTRGRSGSRGNSSDVIISGSGGGGGGVSGEQHLLISSDSDSNDL